MKAKVERVSAITLNGVDMQRSLGFYRDLLGMELLYGGPNAGFSSLRIPGTEFPIINLQKGQATAGWRRMIFHVADVDAFWTHLKNKGFNPDMAHNPAWEDRH